MPSSITGGWRAFSTLVQANIAAGQIANTSLPFEAGDLMEPEPETSFMNDSEITGEVLPTTYRLLNRKLTGKHKGKAFAHLVGLFASMAMGKDTVSTITGPAYKHQLEIEKGIVELPYRTMVENDGLAQVGLVGVACVGFTLSGQRGGFVEFEADLIGQAAEGPNALDKPARIAESYLAYGECNLTRGGTVAGGAVTGGTSLSADLVSFKLGFKNNGKGIYRIGDASGNIGQIRRGQTYAVDLEAELEINDQTHRTALLAGTEYVMNIPIIGGTAAGTAKYTIDVVLPRVVYTEAKKGVNDGILKIAAKFGVLADPTNGGLIINVINLQPTSYLAAA